MSISPLRRGPHAVVALAFLACTVARAEDGPRVASTPLLPTYKVECAACHVAYPPGLLPATSWQRLMGDLPRHYGVDASLEAATTRTLAAWLVAHAASNAAAPPADRITRSAWFAREHDEVGAATWALPAVQSRSNCAACHTRADQGDFHERNIRIPR